MSADLADTLAAERGRLERVAMSILKNHADAADVYQETCLKAWRQRHRYDAERGALVPWLVTMARRLAVDSYRRRARRDVAETQEEQESSLMPKTGQKSTDIETLLTGLRPRHRAVLVAHYLEERGVEAIARAEGVPVSTIRSRLHAARTAVRRRAKRPVDRPAISV